MEKYRHFFSDEVIAQAQTLKVGRTWKEVADILECDVGSLKVTISSYKKGKNKGTVSRHERERKELERLVLDGKSGTDIARENNISVSAVNSRLQRMGLDAEMRAELLTVPTE